MTLAPVGLFVYRRPDHTARMIDSLLACDGVDETPIHVFSDGPRTDADRSAVAEVRRIVEQRLGSRATMTAREHNVGLATSITEGVSSLVNGYGRVIVVEDDLVLDREFLAFLNAGLDCYADEPRVMAISGFAYELPRQEFLRPSFLPMPSSWGWATWQRSWAAYDPAAAGWQRLEEDGDLRERFDLGGAVDNAWMLAAQQRGELDSWAIRWEWSVFRRDGLVLYPPHSLVENTGFDGSGTHGGWLARRITRRHGARGDLSLPVPVALDAERQAATSRFLRSRNLGKRFPFLRTIRRLLRR